MSAAALLLLLGVAGAGNAALDKCRALDREFDTKNMPKPCQAAADDSALSVAERVEALRLLAFAHILNGDDALAEPAFLKMLVFSPSAELPADAGPRFRQVFNAVKRRFDADGAVAVTFTPPPAPEGDAPVELQVDVADKLGRVVGARVRSVARAGGAPLEDRLVRNELAPGQVRFTGKVPEPREVPADGLDISYEVVLEGWEAQPVGAASGAPLKGEYRRQAAGLFGGSGAGDGSGAGNGGGGGDGEFPWTAVTLTGVGVLVAGGIAAGVAACFAGPCRNQEAWVRIKIAQEAP